MKAELDTEPLRKLLTDNEVGAVVRVEQGAANTPDEFSRIITIHLSKYDRGMDLIDGVLHENDAPPGTLITAFDADDKVRDRFILNPPNTD
jgi:hypothetical protein